MALACFLGTDRTEGCFQIGPYPYFAFREMAMSGGAIPPPDSESQSRAEDDQHKEDHMTESRERRRCQRARQRRIEHRGFIHRKLCNHAAQRINDGGNSAIGGP